MNIAWEKWFEIGHESIDFEHKTFFILIHKLDEFASNGRSHDELRRVIEEIIKYADFHFLSEENVMFECGYKDRERHSEIHRKLMSKLREDATTFDGEVNDVNEIVIFLFEWLLRHTIEEDAKIAQAVKEMNLKKFFGKE